MLRVHTPGGSIFLCEMMLVPPSWKRDVKLIWLHHIYLKNNRDSGLPNFIRIRSETMGWPNNNHKMSSDKRSVPDRVRTILALGNWVLGSICRYWVVLLLGDIFFHCDTQYDADQTAVSTVHMITILTSLVWLLSAEDGREREGVECKLYIVIIQFWDFTWYCVVYISLQNQYIAMLHSSIGIGIGYWYR